jgi:hypothetical protein
MDNPVYNWNTYSGIGFNRLLKLPECCELRFAVFLPESGLYTPRFFFTEAGDVEAGQVTRVVNHAPYGEYIQIEFDFQGYRFEIAAASSKWGDFACLLKPLTENRNNVILLLEVERLWKSGELVLKDDGLISFLLEKGKWANIMAGAIIDQNYGYGLYVDETALKEDLQKGSLNRVDGTGMIAVQAFRGGETVAVAIAESGMPDPDRVEAVLQDARRIYLANRPNSGGLIDDSLETLNTIVNSQVAWDNWHGYLYTPVTRRWNDFYQLRLGLDPQAEGPVFGLWDSLFAALMHAGHCREAAEGNLRLLFDENVLTECGYPPNYVASPIKSGDRSQPPLAGLVAWKVYQKQGNKTLLEDLFPHLLRWNYWWLQARDGNGDGLLEWGSDDNVAMPGNDAGTLFGAKCESGMDNSPLFDDAVFDEEKKVMNLNSIGLSSLYATDCLYLSRIAGELNQQVEMDKLLHRYDKTKEAIENLLWSDQNRLYLDRYWDGLFSKRISPCSFFPLLARIPAQGKAEEIVREHLLDEEAFWGEYVIPSISRKDPAFNDQLYWRGRIWPPLNYLVYLGLKEYGFDDIACRLALKTYRLFMKEWTLNGHCHENYHALTGLGCDVPGKKENFDHGSMGNIGSDPFYTWGALLLKPVVDELIDTDPDGGLCFGGAFFEHAVSVAKVYICGDYYSIDASVEKLEVNMNGNLLLSAKPAVMIRGFAISGSQIEFRIKGKGSTNINLHTISPCEAARVIFDGQKIDPKPDQGAGDLSLFLQLDDTYKECRVGLN